MKNKKILFLHGSGGGFTPEEVGYIAAAFKPYDIDFIAPTLDYNILKDNPYFFKLILHLAKQSDVIVGNSMGGYWAYHLGKATGKPTLCFNPALSNITMSYNWFEGITKYKTPKRQKIKRILISTEDTTVNYEETKRFLAADYPQADIQYLDGEDHSISFELIFEHIIKFANDRRPKQKRKVNTTVDHLS